MMSEKNVITWDRNPKNGISSFYTQASFLNWLPEESHESRLAANLEKLCKGVIIPKPTCTEIKVIGKQANSFSGVDQPSGNIEQEVNATGPSNTSARKIQKCPHKKEKKHAHDEILVTEGDKSFKVSEIATEKESQPNTSQGKTSDIRSGNQLVDNDVNGGENIDFIGTEIDKQDASNSTARLTECPQLSPSKETDLNDAEKRKKAMECNMLFFNDKERKDKYVPVLTRKRPRSNKQSLTAEEQKKYLEMKRRFGKLIISQLTPQQEADYTVFKALSEKVEQEQDRFLKHLRYVFFQCEEDYRYIHREAAQYIHEKFIMKRQRVTQYPRFYNPIKRINLSEVGDNNMELQFIQPLLQLGTVPRMVLPQIVPGLPQPCTPTDCEKVAGMFPTARDVVKGVCVWNNEECSQDMNAEQLAVPNKCDFVLSSSAVSHLIDQQGYQQGQQRKLWNIPITIRDYNLQDGDKLVTHKVIYIDKPMTKVTQYTFQDKNKLYQKYALKSVAVRLKQKPHVFANIKPSCEVEKYVKIEQVQKELEDYNQRVQEDKASRDVFQDNTSVDHNKKSAKKRKKMPLDIEESRSKSVGLFDLENDIDDLETFGMEKSWKMAAKSDKNPDMLSPSKELENMFSAEAKSGTKERTSMASDLEMFKHELESLKAKQLKTNVKTSEAMNSKGTRETYEGNLTTSSQTSGLKPNANKKNALSLSERLKQMSTIRSKLNMKPVQCELSTSTVKMLQGPSEKLTDSMETGETRDEAQNDNCRRSVETESDSDQSDDGLVIDMPDAPSTASNSLTDSPKPSATEPIGLKAKLHPPDPLEICNIDNQPKSPVLDSPDSPKKSFEDQFEGQSHPTTCLEIPLDEDSNDSVLRDYSNMNYEELAHNNTDAVVQDGSSVTQEHITEDNKDRIVKQAASDGKIDSYTEDSMDVTATEINKQEILVGGDTNTHGVTTRGSKRRSIESSLIEETPPKRRSLRSSRSNDLKSGMHIQTCNKISSETSPDTVSSKIRDQTRKPASSSDRLTRSRSASSEVSTEEISPVRRVTRKSLDKVISPDGLSANTMAMKRGRNSQSTSDTIEINQAVSINSQRTAQDSARVMEETDEKCMEMDEEYSGNVNADNVNDIDQNHITPKRRGRPPSNKLTIAKKIENENEGKKIKAISGTMKNKMMQKAGNEPGEVGPSKFYIDGSKEKAKAPNENEIQSNIKTEENTNCKQGQNLGFDNILSLQMNLWKPPESKGPGSGAFAAQHGMSKVLFPLKHNITYHQWKLGDLNLLIRSSYDGFANPQGFVHITTKMEYQPFFGFEKQTVNDIAKNWISTYIRPKCTLVRARMNPYNSEIMMMDSVELKDIVPPDCAFTPSKAMTDLQCILEGLKDLPAGQYLLNNQPKEDHVSVFKAAPDGESAPFDLHYYHSTSKTYKNGKEATRAKWIAIDTELFLQHQKKNNLVPCTYNPNKFQTKPQQEKKPGKKKKRRRPKKKKTD